MEQCQTGGESKVSAIVTLKNHRGEKLQQISDADSQVPPSCS